MKIRFLPILLVAFFQFFFMDWDLLLAKERGLFRKSSNILRGKENFFDPSRGENGLSCSSCHEGGDHTKTGLILSGPPLFGWKLTYKNRKFKTIGEAADDCGQKYMLSSGLDKSVRAFLGAYLETRMGDRVTLMGENVSQPQKIKPGDLKKGKRVFFRACSVCHPGGGVGIGPSLFKLGKSPQELAEIIRKGIFPPRRGDTPMPPFSLQALDHRNMEHLISFIDGLTPFMGGAYRKPVSFDQDPALLGEESPN